ncbi:hypothetical protein K3495_g5405 [Podosphaera aphanis]|nr:hypothetical protein K3495_g5405 [Podosphaera aphanis]
MRKTPPRESVVNGSYWIRTSFLLSRVGHVSKLPRLYLGERPGWCTTPPSDPGTHLKVIEKVHLAIAREILPVFRTIPSISLLRETGLLPAEVTLDNIAQRAAVRTRRIDPRHPLTQRGIASLSQPILFRFSRACSSILESEYFDPLINPLWVTEETKQDSLIRIGGPTSPIETRAQRFNNYLSSLPRNDIQIYSDGSKLCDGNSGGGYVIFQYGIRLCSEAFPLGKFRDSYDAEAHAALRGIRAAISLPSARFAC